MTAPAGADGPTPGAAPRRRPPTLLTLGGPILVFELGAVFFAGLTAFGFKIAPLGVLIGILVGFTVLIVAAGALLRTRPRAGIALGWVVQALFLLGGIWQPTVYLIAAIFAVLWGIAVYWGRRIDREKALLDRELGPA